MLGVWHRPRSARATQTGQCPPMRALPTSKPSLCSHPVGRHSRGYALSLGGAVLVDGIETPFGRQPELSVNSQASGRGLFFPVQVLWALEQDHISVQRRLWHPHSDTPFSFQRCGPHCSSRDGGRPAPSGSAHPGYSGRAQPGKLVHLCLSAGLCRLLLPQVMHFQDRIRCE